MNTKVKARAIVRVEVEVHVDSVWGDDCSLGQLHKQGVEGALSILARLFQHSPGVLLRGEPRVTAVLVDEAAEKTT